MIGHLQLTLLAVTAIIAAHLGDAVAVCESNSTLEYQPTGRKLNLVLHDRVAIYH